LKPLTDQDLAYAIRNISMSLFKLCAFK
jgi:hypothetical protein